MTVFTRRAMEQAAAQPLLAERRPGLNCVFANHPTGDLMTRRSTTQKCARCSVPARSICSIRRRVSDGPPMVASVSPKLRADFAFVGKSPSLLLDALFCHAPRRPEISRATKVPRRWSPTCGAECSSRMSGPARATPGGEQERRIGRCQPALSGKRRWRSRGAKTSCGAFRHRLRRWRCCRCCLAGRDVLCVLSLGEPSARRWSTWRRPAKPLALGCGRFGSGDRVTQRLSEVFRCCRGSWLAQTPHHQRPARQWSRPYGVKRAARARSQELSRFLWVRQILGIVGPVGGGKRAWAVVAGAPGGSVQPGAFLGRRRCHELELCSLRASSLKRSGCRAFSMSLRDTVALRLPESAALAAVRRVFATGAL